MRLADLQRIETMSGDVRSYETPLLDVRLHPHRSLSRAAFRRLMIFTVCASTCVSLPFYLMGAWPVVGFFGLDVALLYLAFRANFRAARLYEHLRLTSLELLFARVSAKGARREWRFNPSWVRFERVDDEEFGAQRLALVSRGRSLEIGRFLPPDEKAAFASRLVAALAAARRGPVLS